VKRYLIFLICLLYSALSIAQDKNYAREIIDTLTSPSMFGRGYVNKGDQIAANYIASQFKKFGLKKFDDNYLQNFNMAINTFPDTIEVDIDQEKLVPGKDYVLFSSSPGVSGTFDLIRALADSSGKLRFLYDDFSNKVIVTNIDQREFKKYDSLNPKGVIFLMDKRVQWHVSDGGKINEYFQMQVLKEKISTNAKTISIHAKNKFYKNYQTQNVIGFIEGKVQPDSFFVFTAHYDHLGQMGAEVYFPGANDNASGTATVLDLARYYSKPENQPDYSIAFMAFGAEEAGLLGSFNYANNPFFSLDKIKFLINLDMVGSGSEGIKVVNGTIFESEFEKLVQLNRDHQFIASVNKRGEAANSDHYPFYAKGVPAFFMYTLGDECKEYHNIYDVSENVPLTEYEDLFRLLTSFIKAD